MTERARRAVVLLALFDLLAWFLYFVVCAAPFGSAFLYVDF